MQIGSLPIGNRLFHPPLLDVYKYIRENTTEMTPKGTAALGLVLALMGILPMVIIMKKYFYGSNKSGPYFEGWYFKCQAGDGRAFAVIPAFHIRQNGERSASIQVITDGQAWYLEYPVIAFDASQGLFCVEIGGNRFSEAGLLLDIEKEGLSLHGRVEFGALQRLGSDIMGPFRWLANMECVHSVISMRHLLQGRLEINDSLLDFNKGIGYIEADRGSSFPTTYLWTQCLWDNCSMMLSIATIPLGKLHFTGCICAIVINGREYRLATYRGVKILNWSSKGASLCQGKYRLEVELLEQKPQPLRAPSDGNMIRTIHESLCARVRYRFWQGKELSFDHTDDSPSFEYAQKP